MSKEMKKSEMKKYILREILRITRKLEKVPTTKEFNEYNKKKLLWSDIRRKHGFHFQAIISRFTVSHKSEIKEITLKKSSKLIKDSAIRLMKKLEAYPTMTQLEGVGITREMIRTRFHSHTKFMQIIEKENPTLVQIVLNKKQLNEQRILEIRNEISEKYMNLCNKLRRKPRQRELNEIGLKGYFLSKHFGGIARLHAYCCTHYEKEMSRVHDYDDLISDRRLAKTRKNIKKFKRYIISSIGKGETNKEYLNALYNYAEKNSARILLAPSDIKFDEICPFLLDEYKKGKLDIIFEHTKINDNLYINAIRINEKVVNPTAGIDRHILDHASFIFASPKQTTRTVPLKNRSYSRFMWSPGAVTKPNYINDPLMKKKRDVMADNDHIFGALIVERKDGYFFERNTQADKDNCIVDWGIRYFPSGRWEYVGVDSFVMGDLHSFHKHEATFNKWLWTMDFLDTKTAVLHDVFDCTSLNPHEKDKATTILAQEIESANSCPEELVILAEDLNKVRSVVKDKVYIVDSNHDDMFTRAFDSGLVWRHPKNALLGSLLYPKVILSKIKDDYSRAELMQMLSKVVMINQSDLKEHFKGIFCKKPLLEYALDFYGLKNQDKKIKFLHIDDSLKIGGFELAEHGHKGANGARGSVVSSTRSYDKKLSGHTHVEEQMNYVASVGHTEDNPRYARGGASGWSRASAIVYKTGQFQYVREIDGQLRSFEGAFLTLPQKQKLKKAQKAKFFEPKKERHGLLMEA